MMASPRMYAESRYGAYGRRPGAAAVAAGADIGPETTQGLVALARRPAFEEERLFEGAPLVLVAVGIQDPGGQF